MEITREIEQEIRPFQPSTVVYLVQIWNLNAHQFECSSDAGDNEAKLMTKLAPEWVSLLAKLGYLQVQTKQQLNNNM